MRIQSVTAHAFGPFRDETLELADGMTVIVGDNEAGKSSWHAAIFAALCGMRRRRGAGTAAERQFAERHKPWSHDQWLVGAQIELDDGRPIEMRQDLATRVDCSATDRTFGRDVSAEIMNEGAPDAARWLGLDRSSFVATACINQGQVLRVVDDAQELQNHLQRAAATAGSAGTAAKAIERLDAFVRERIGTDRTNSTKPLRRALDEVRRAEEELDAARASHKLYVDRVSRIDELRRAAADASDELKLHEAAAARDDAQEKQRRVERARKLHESLGGMEPPRFRTMTISPIGCPKRWPNGVLARRPPLDCSDQASRFEKSSRPYLQSRTETQSRTTA
ncbi:AAA family ATPase [Mycolicibacterium smegmatis]|uniref:AAA family ATPase n=1 Tax=Mycolicibacterium smegmatis TaxID=1772 RepID=UPI001E508026|nr:AAA family ATPase [Mycolicibacterium smegmatis]UGU30628.1 AAA family ATPase [Mycolicibacterium smegmatis]ULN71545.1 AAA family ATPase [Mycolicibacterium smegmatis]